MKLTVDASRGFQHRDADWQRYFGHASNMIDLQLDHRYEIGLADHWQAGLDRLSDASK